MTGGSTRSSTSSGASSTDGSPGMSARITPAMTSRIAGGISRRAAPTATPATTASSRTRIWTVSTMGHRDTIMARQEPKSRAPGADAPRGVFAGPSPGFVLFPQPAAREDDEQQREQAEAERQPPIHRQ